MILEKNRNERNIIISNEEAGKGLLDLLTARFTYLPREKWHDYISSGRILRNGSPALADAVLARGDRVTFQPEPRPEPWVDTRIVTLYEDDDLLLLNKPPDLPCHPGGIYLHNTLWAILREKYDPVYLVNRLDRETSGIVGVAKHKEAATFLYLEMKERRVEKEYLALVEGVFPDRLEARGWLKKDEKSPVYKKRTFVMDLDAFEEGDRGDPGTQFCETFFSAEKNLPGPVSLVQCRPVTGKTHQIRATLVSLGYPVVGDKLYGIDDTLFIRFPMNRITPEEWERLRMPHQALHCSRLCVNTPRHGRIEVKAGLPDTWNRVLS
jgi:23S rRNA pseudouridine1911/1915/1917 synthase